MLLSVEEKGTQTPKFILLLPTKDVKDSCKAYFIGMLFGSYSGTGSAVKCGRGLSGFFYVNVGVWQGCVLTL